MKRILLVLLASASLSLNAMDQHKKVIPTQSGSRDIPERTCAQNVVICACLPFSLSCKFLLDILCCPIDCCDRLGASKYNVEPNYPDICLPRTQQGGRELAEYCNK